jgi:hypothetical protein
MIGASGFPEKVPSRRKAFVPKSLSFLSHFVLLARVAILRSADRVNAHSFTEST